MIQLSLRDKAKVVLEHEIAVRYVELLLQQAVIKRRDADFIEHFYGIIKEQSALSPIT